MSLPRGIVRYSSINDDAPKYKGLSESATYSSSEQYGAIPIKQSDTYPLETKKQRFRRYFSLAIIMFSMLISSVGFSSIFGSIWQYYEKIDDSASVSFLGLIVAAYSLGSLLAAPLFGLWSSYRPVSEPLIFSMIVYSIGNLLYVYAENFTDNEKWILFASRLIVGVGSANISVMRSYCMAASREKERDTVMSFLFVVQVIGFILGPALGLLFQPLGDNGEEWEAIKLHFNLYTGPGFLGIFLCIVNIILIIIFFKEFNVHGTQTKKAFIDLYECCENCNDDLAQPLLGTQQQRYDRIAACICIFLFFIIVLVFAAEETLMAPLAKDQYAWNNQDTTLYVNIISAAISILCVGSLIGTKFVTKWISERVVLIIGLIVIICGLIIWMPYGPDHPDVEMTGLTNSSNGKHIANNPDLGCDFRKQSWCLHQPKIYLPQYVVSLCVITVGYASSVLLCYTIFSKILGPQPQALMMSYITMFASLGRVVGPLLLAHVYRKEGPWVTFLVSICFVLLGVLTVVAFYKRLVPYSVYQFRLQSVKTRECSSPNHVTVNADQSNSVSHRNSS